MLITHTSNCLQNGALHIEVSFFSLWKPNGGFNRCWESITIGEPDDENELSKEPKPRGQGQTHEPKNGLQVLFQLS